jgi:hypothetical protein
VLAVKNLIAPPRENQTIIDDLIPDLTMTAIAEPDQATTPTRRRF